MAVTTDPIADMLTRIRNATIAKHTVVSFPASNLKREICKILAENNYIKKFVIIDDSKQGIIKAMLKYNNNESVIQGLSRVSTPGRRIYMASNELPKVLHGLGIAIISTSKGVMTDYMARKNNVGGEVLCKVW